MIQPAIVVVGYNRPDSLERLLKSIGNANYSYENIPLVISLDKSSNESEVKEVAEKFQWTYGEKTVRIFDERQGLKKHILQCGNLSEKYGAVIILEDDLYVAPDFYNFAVQAVDYYKSDDRVAGIGLYSHEWNGYAGLPFQKRVKNADVFAGQFSITWGQCWTQSQWGAFRSWLDQNPKYEFCDYIPKRINRWSGQSWGKFFVRYIVDYDKYYIIPNYSMTTNFSDVGQHSQNINTDHQVQLWERVGGTYRFLQLDDLVRYDIFFEPILDTMSLFGLAKEEVDIDLNCTNNKNNTRRYLVTTKRLRYEVIKSYSLSLRPVEKNIIESIPGTGIYLYDTSKKNKKPDRKKANLLAYYIRGYNFVQLIPHVWSNMIYILRIKMNLYKMKLKRKWTFRQTEGYRNEREQKNKGL